GPVDVGSRKAVFLLQTDPFLPKPVLRALREAESLTRAGWDGAFVSWIKDEQPAQEGKDSYATHRVKVPVPPIGTSFVHRGLAYRDASRKLRDAAQKETPDLLVAHDFEVLSGALAGGRGLDILLGALPTLPASTKALIVGGPDEEAERLRALARAEGLQDRVRVDGYRAFRELAPYYASMDVGVILLDRRPNHE